MSKTACNSLLLTLALALLPLGVVLAADLPWPDREPALQVSPSEHAARHSSLVEREGALALAWAGTEEAVGIYVTREVAGAWGGEVYTVSQAAGSRNPTLVMGETGALSVLWLEGDSLAQNRIRQADIGAGTNHTLHTVIEGIYGEIFPHLKLHSDGAHLVFAAGLDAAYRTQGDLYYAFRSGNTGAWETPTVVITRAQVRPDEAGGVWRPRVALESNPDRIHIVWEQTTETISRTVWHVAGTRNGTGVTWGAPQQVSPDGQLAVRPDLLVLDGELHVVWSEIAQGTNASPEAQYINHRRHTGTQWSPAIRRVDAEPVGSNKLFPTAVAPRIAAGGDQLCVAWPGYRGASGQEEILVSCSKSGGLSWNPPLNVSADPDHLSLSVSLQVDQTGELHLAWQRTSVGPTYHGIFYRGGRAEFRVYLPLVLRGGR